MDERRIVMSAKRWGCIAGSAIAGLLGMTAASGAAHAAPPLPPPPPYVPGVPLPFPGSYLYPYNVITVPAPATFDARGVRATDNADPTSAADGMPGSQMGLSPNKSNYLTSANARYGIGAGLTPPQTVSPGMNIGAGMEVPALEDPGGQPPKSPTGAESSQPTSVPAVPGQPAPILEDPNGQPPGSSSSSGSPGG